MGLLNKDNEKKIGSCQLCGKHYAILTFAIGQYHGLLWTGWICDECLEKKHKNEIGVNNNG